jgi:lipoprotein-anchoring transpeptidase ErfK/SrfK
MVSRRAVMSGVVGITAGAAVAGCSSTAGAVTSTWSEPGQAPSTSTGSSPSAAAVNLTVSPADAATNVSPADPISISADSGTIQTVSVTAGTTRVAGSLGSDQRTWKSTAPLAYGQTYTVTVTMADGVTKTCSFSTVKPTRTASITFQANAMAALKTGGTYGCGQIVIVRFSQSVTDKAAAQKAVDVTTSPSVDGKFYWLDKQTLHWRPEKYFAKGTKISVAVKVLGVNLGGGVYGASNASTNYTIGRQLVAYGDSNTHQVQVYVDGALVRTMPTSMGKGGTTTGSSGETIDFWTRSGAHVVLMKSLSVNMSSASYGIKDKNDPNYYDETVPLATRISYSGEYLHSAPWNLANLGKHNTSHGCLNLSPADAQWVYDTFLVGDVVEVKNTPKTLPTWDGLGDWVVPYASYGS